jgi:nucleotide-binding universal stress UspA family protein
MLTASADLDLAGRAVLLATDGSPHAIAAAHLALRLAERHRAKINVVSVVDTRSAPIPSPLFAALSAGDAVAGTALHREQESGVRAGLASAMGVVIDWPVRVMLGTPSTLIVQESQRVDAALIVLGLRRHGRLDRVVRDETTLNVMRNATIPVLGVVAELTRLPRRVMAAVDFSEGSLLALQAGKAVTGDDALLVLAHVQPMSGYLLDEGQARIYEMGVEAGFAKLGEEVGAKGVRTDHVVLHHGPEQGPAQALLEYGDEMGAELITAGSVQHSRLDRWMIGTVSGELVRDGRRSVLIVPPRRRD